MKSGDPYGDLLTWTIEGYHSLVHITKKYHAEQRKIKNGAKISPSFAACIKELSARLDELYKKWGAH